MKKPTLAEVTAYCRERGNTVSPEAFLDYYESVGWRVGRNPMKNWQAAIRTWEHKQGGSRPAKCTKHPNSGLTVTGRCWECSTGANAFEF